MNTCLLCGLSEDDEVKFGKFLTSNEIAVHQFCLVKFEKISIVLKFEYLCFEILPALCTDSLSTWVR